MTRNKTQAELSRTENDQTLQGIVGDTDAAEVDLYGFQVIYTTGEFRVRREPLIEMAEGLGVPDWMLPAETSAHRAFPRALADLLDGEDELDVEYGDTRVRLNKKKNGSRFSWTIGAEMYFEAEQTDGDTGQWVAVENSDGEQGLGVIEYDDGRITFRDYIPEDHSLAPLWHSDSHGLKAKAEELFEAHKQSHTGKDINNLTYYLVNQWTDAVKLRDACYFVPATHTWRDRDGNERPIEDLIDVFQHLYGWIDEEAWGAGDKVVKPDHAQHTEMHVVEIMDTDRQSEMVERKAEQKLEEMASDAIADIVDEMADDDTLVEDIVDEVSDSISHIEAVADNYSAMLKIENSVERVLKGEMGDLSDEKEDIVRDVLDEVDGAPALD